MKEFLTVSRKSKFYFILILLFSPLFYGCSYFLTYIFFALFGEPIALTYVNILIFSLIYTLTLLLVYYGSRLKAENPVTISYYLSAFIIPYCIVCMLFGTISIWFGILI